jgi:hypothetical protein
VFSTFCGNRLVLSAIVFTFLFFEQTYGNDTVE